MFELQIWVGFWKSSKTFTLKLLEEWIKVIANSYKEEFIRQNHSVFFFIIQKIGVIIDLHQKKQLLGFNNWGIQGITKPFYSSLTWSKRQIQRTDNPIKTVRLLVQTWKQDKDVTAQYLYKDYLYGRILSFPLATRYFT